MTGLTIDAALAFIDRDFLDGAMCAACCEAVLQGAAEAATIANGSGQSIVSAGIRRTSSVRVSSELRHDVHGRLEGLRRALEEHFGTALRAVQQPEFLLYRRGDFFSPHQDNSTDSVHGPELRGRQVSAVVFLNRRARVPADGDYCGGELRLYTPRNPRAAFIEIRGEPGLLVAFRSSVLHEVRPVNHGDRCTIAAWYTGS